MCRRADLEANDEHRTTRGRPGPESGGSQRSHRARRRRDRAAWRRHQASACQRRALDHSARGDTHAEEPSATLNALFVCALRERRTELRHRSTKRLICVIPGTREQPVRPDIAYARRVLGLGASDRCGGGRAADEGQNQVANWHATAWPVRARAFAKSR